MNEGVVVVGSAAELGLRPDHDLLVGAWLSVLRDVDVEKNILGHARLNVLKQHSRRTALEVYVLHRPPVGLDR
ncbi:hypothetical protein ES703_119473 [subsurface metagenome]